MAFQYKMLKLFRSKFESQRPLFFDKSPIYIADTTLLMVVKKAFIF